MLPAREPEEVFAALGDPTRRRIVDRLAADGPRTATELAGGFPVSRQAVTRHLAALADAGLLVTERRGREVRYGLVPDRLDTAAAWLVEIGGRWDRRLAALERHLADGR